MAREWRDAWGLLSDRRIVAGGSEWAIGDRLVCRRNDYGLGVRNGTARDGRAARSARRAPRPAHRRRRVVRLPADYLAHARHGYALTGHVSQGESVDRTFVLASPERGGAEWAYVAASRQRHDLQVFVVHHEAEDVEEALARAWSRSQAKSLALDLVDAGRAGGGDRAGAGDLDRRHARAAARPRRGAGARRARRARARGRGARATSWRASPSAAPRSSARPRGLRGGRRAPRPPQRPLERIPAWRRRERAERAGRPRAGGPGRRAPPGRGRAARGRAGAARARGRRAARAGRSGPRAPAAERGRGAARAVERGLDRAGIDRPSSADRGRPPPGAGSGRLSGRTVPRAPSRPWREGDSPDLRPSSRTSAAPVARLPHGRSRRPPVGVPRVLDEGARRCAGMRDVRVSGLAGARHLRSTAKRARRRRAGHLPILFAPSGALLAGLPGARGLQEEGPETRRRPSSCSNGVSRAGASAVARGRGAERPAEHPSRLYCGS